MPDKNTASPEAQRLKRILPAAIAAALALSTNPLAAQVESDSEQEAEELAIEEVLVTATKREAYAQQLSMSISALTQSFLEQQSVLRFEDVSDLVAGLQIVNTQPGTNIIAIRGITTLGGQSAPIGYYIDEAPVSAFAVQPDLAMWDLERIEVLRGPQGTLFGDGSMGGTIRAITNKPDTSGFYGRVALQGWNYDGGSTSYDAKGVVNIPLSETFAVRVLAGYKSDGGWIDVPELGLKDANGYDQTTGRVAARWLPSDDLMLDLSWERNKLDLDRSNLQTSPGLFDPLNYLPPGYAIPLDSNDYSLNEYDLYNLTVNWSLDRFSVVSATSYFDQSFESSVDLNSIIAGTFFGGPVAAFLPDSNATQIFPPGNDESSFSQEIRLVSNGDETLDWTVGVFYKDADQVQINGFDLNVFLDLGLIDPNLSGVITPVADETYAPIYDTSRTQWSLFDEIDYQLADDWNLIAGLRYFTDNVDRVLDDPGSPTFGAVPGVYKSSGSDSAWAPKLTLTWQASDTANLYFNVAKGFRAGSANVYSPFSDEIPAIYGPETLWTYEVGYKANPRPNLITNFFVYYNDWTDLQLSLNTSDGLLSYTNNAGSAEATGAEFEITWLASERLTLSANAAYVDAEISESVLTAGGFLEVASKGNSIPYVPKWSGAITANYVQPISSNWNLNVSGSYTYRGSNYSDAANSDNQKNKAYGTLNARIGVESDSWGLYLFGRNLTDDEGTSSITQPVAALPDLVYSNYIPPRTWGVEVRAWF
jgi:outer membrane receptor protein involved in Fe transport